MNQLVTRVGEILEENRELRGRLRVTAKRERNLIYHMEPGAGLKINIEIGKKFFEDPSKLRERLDLMVTYACLFKRGTTLANAVHAFEEVDE